MTFKGFKIDLNWLANKLIFHSGMMATIIRKAQSSSFENEIRLWLFAVISKLSPPPLPFSNETHKMPRGETIISDPVMFIARVCSNYIYTGGGWIYKPTRLNLAPSLVTDLITFMDPAIWK